MSFSKVRGGFSTGWRLGVYVAGRNTPAPTAQLEDVNYQYFYEMSNLNAYLGWVLSDNLRVGQLPCRTTSVSDNFRLEDVNHQYFLKCLILKYRGGFSTGAATWGLRRRAPHTCTYCKAGRRNSIAFLRIS